LENTIQRALAVATNDIIQSFHLAPPPRSGGPSASFGPAVTIPVGTTLEEADNLLISETLNQCGGDKEKAAKMLGVSSRTLYRHFSKDEG
jgi:DNA-binding NtrC family response regulator